jgi:hypothetical protein
VPNPPAGTLTFQWDFSDGTSLTGQRVTPTFMPPAGVMPRLPLPLTVTLTVTASDGTVARLVHSETVPESFWSALWAPVDGINFQDTDNDDVPDAPGQFQLSQAELIFSRYRLFFDMAAGLVPNRLQVDYLNRHDGAFCFRGSAGQGKVEERTDVAVTSKGVIVNGWLAPLITAKSVSARLRLTRRFTPATLTSDVRHRDGDVETLQSASGFLPNALSCKPLGDPDVEVLNPKVDAAVPDLTRYLSWLVAALVALVPSAILLGLLLPFLVAIFPAAVVATLVAAGIGAILSALIAAGFAWVITDVVSPPLLSWLATDQFRQFMNSHDTKTKIAKLGLLTDAGEGLSEAIARQAIRQAKEDGHDVPDVTDSGRDRTRPQLFETIVVTEGTAQVKMNVGRG